MSITSFFFILIYFLIDGGSACDCGCVVAEFGESHPVCSATEASCGVLPSPSHLKRPVSSVASL